MESRRDARADVCARVMVLFKFNPFQLGLRKTMKEYKELTFRYVKKVGAVGANLSAREARVFIRTPALCYNACE